LVGSPDPPQVWDQRRQFRLLDFRVIQGFADNFKLPLDGGAQHQVPFVLGKGVSRHKILNGAAGFKGVKQAFLQCGFHRSLGQCAPLRRGNRGFEWHVR
jgi:hypothetical protein